jgi:hypothetical protein
MIAGPSGSGHLDRKNTSRSWVGFGNQEAAQEDAQAQAQEDAQEDPLGKTGARLS